MRIAIMQPYFIPYAGYFRLFLAADLFVIFDCVQFVRRGFIHRNRLVNTKGEWQWLTLPLKKAPQEIAIKDIFFAPDYQDEWRARLNFFPQLAEKNQTENDLLATIRTLTSSPLAYIVNTLKKTCALLNLPFTIAYSSALNLPETLKGAEKIIAIAKHFGAHEYINLSGGRLLYQPETFKQHGIKLQFLSAYEGSYASILQSVLATDLTHLRNDIIDQSKLWNS